MPTTKKTLFQGVATALITPFKEGTLDLEAYKKLLHFQKENGVAALVIAGTTGESPTLSERERVTLLEIARDELGNTLPLIMGTGANDTEKVLQMSREAQRHGADGLLIVTPYYNKGTKNGIISHYLTVAEAVDLPICLYNVPSRTGVDLSLDILEKLAEHENIVALKEANGSIDRVAETVAHLGDALTVYSGNDSQILPILSLGGKGVISVVSNLYPTLTADLCHTYFSRNNETARAIQLRLLPIIKLLFKETNPAPIKAAMKIAAMCENQLRLPLAPVSENLYSELRYEMDRLEKASCNQ
ncbi:MAG: 4-hydroxy-tetrahydrodipicolinate synthase [Clostridia bacterium]|nr:4-hydroxy-tetrahydrodipicolinate synthase [Clostridia bacterium]